MTMATIWPLLLLFSVISTAEAQQAERSFLKPGTNSSWLSPMGTNSSWLSPSGLYAFGFYKQGSGYAVGIFIAGILNETVVWTANRNNPPVSSDVKLVFTSDGHLVLQTAQGREIMKITDNIEGANAASMLDSGNFVLYKSDNTTIWESFDRPTDTLLPGQKLTSTKDDSLELISSHSDTDQSEGKFRLLMQQDGYLVIYPVGTENSEGCGCWDVGVVSIEKSNVTLNFDVDGRLYLLNETTGVSILNITTEDTTKGVINRLIRIDPNGILCQYSRNMDQNGDWNVTWQSSKDKCKSRGPCGGTTKTKNLALIIGISLLSFACIILAIIGIALYKNRVWLYRTFQRSDHQ